MYKIIIFFILYSFIYLKNRNLKIQINVINSIKNQCFNNSVYNKSINEEKGITEFINKIKLELDSLWNINSDLALAQLDLPHELEYSTSIFDKKSIDIKVNSKTLYINDNSNILNEIDLINKILIIKREFEPNYQFLFKKKLLYFFSKNLNFNFTFNIITKDVEILNSNNEIFKKYKFSTDKWKIDDSSKKSAFICSSSPKKLKIENIIINNVKIIEFKNNNISIYNFENNDKSVLFNLEKNIIELENKQTINISKKKIIINNEMFIIDYNLQNEQIIVKSLNQSNNLNIIFNIKENEELLLIKDPDYYSNNIIEYKINNILKFTNLKKNILSEFNFNNKLISFKNYDNSNDLFIANINTESENIEIMDLRRNITGKTIIEINEIHCNNEIYKYDINIYKNAFIYLYNKNKNVGKYNKSEKPINLNFNLINIDKNIYNKYTQYKIMKNNRIYTFYRNNDNLIKIEDNTNNYLCHYDRFNGDLISIQIEFDKVIHNIYYNIEYNIFSKYWDIKSKIKSNKINDDMIKNNKNFSCNLSVDEIKKIDTLIKDKTKKDYINFN